MRRKVWKDLAQEKGAGVAIGAGELPAKMRTSLSVCSQYTEEVEHPQADVELNQSRMVKTLLRHSV